MLCSSFKSSNNDVERSVAVISGSPVIILGFIDDSSAIFRFSGRLGAPGATRIGVFVAVNDRVSACMMLMKEKV
jgi:hypothetical protein